MLAAAIAWEIYERTGSELHLGYVGLARALPVLILSLLGGHVADNFNRRSILTFTQLAFAVIMAALAIWSREVGPLWIGYVLLALLGCTRAFNGPARGSFMPLIIPQETFHNAVTWSTGLFYVSGVLGPILAGLLYAMRHTAWETYTISALFMLFFCLTTTRVNPLVEQAPASSAKFSPGTLFGGMSFVYRDKPVFGALAIDCIGVFLGGAVALLPVYAKDILHVESTGYGLLKSAIFMGSVVSAIVLAHRPPFKNAGRTFLIAVVLWALAVIGFGYSTNAYFAFFFLFVQGAVDNISVVIRHVLVQMRTPDSLRGRVSAVNSMFIDISNELGAFESGLVANWFTPLISVVSGGIGTLIVVGIVAVTNKPLRELKTILPPK